MLEAEKAAASSHADEPAPSPISHSRPEPSKRNLSQEPLKRESIEKPTEPQERGPSTKDDVAGIDVARLNDPRVMQLVVRPDIRSLRIWVDDEAIDDAHRAIEPLFSDKAAVLRLTTPKLKASSLVVFEYDRKVKS